MEEAPLTRTAAALVAAMVGWLTLAPPAHAAPVATVKVGPHVEIVEDGRAVLVDVSARCSAGFSVLEALVTVSQDGVDSDAGFFTLPCDGRWHRSSVEVHAFAPTAYEDGVAQVSGFLLVCDPSSGCPSDGDTKAMRLRA